LMIWPAHGAGSACGKSLGGGPSSSLGYERIANWAFHVKSEEDFVNKVLDGQPEPPRYFADMTRENKTGLPVWSRQQPAALTAADHYKLQEPGTVLLDLRPYGESEKAAVPGALPVPLSRNFTTFVGSVVDFAAPI